MNADLTILTAARITDATTVGRAFLTKANPSAKRFPRINANNTVDYLSDAEFQSSIGAARGDTASEPCSTSVDPSTLTWTQRSEGHDFALISPGFAIPDITAEALRIPTLIISEFGTGSIDTTGATINTTVAANFKGCIAYWETPPAAYWAAEAQIAAMPATSGVVVVGIFKDSSNHIGCYYDGTDIKFDVTIAGVQTLSAGLTIALTAPFKLACVQTQNYLAAFYDSGAGWTLAAVIDVIATVDIATDATRSGYKYYWQFSGTGTGKLDRFRAGIWGGSATSSHYLVTYEDGTPIWDGRDVFFLTSITGVQVTSDNNYGQGHLAVMRWNVDTDVHSVVSHIFTSRSSKTLGDCWGPMRYDRDAGVWRIFVQNSGDMTTATYGTGSAMLMGTSSANLLAGIHTVSVASLPLPSGVLEAYDADFIKISGVWYAGYTEVDTNRYPALATTSDIDGAWTQVAIDTAQQLCEGARWVKFGTVWRLLYSKINTGVSTIRQYTTALVDQGGFTPTGWPQNTSIGGHPMIFGVPLPDGTTKWRALTFDDTPWFTGQTWGYGNYLMFDAAEHLTGYVFDTPSTQAATPLVQAPERTNNISGNAATATSLKTARTIGGVSFDGTANIVPSTIAVADTTSATCYLVMVESATGNLAPKTDEALTYDATTGTLVTTGSFQSANTLASNQIGTANPAGYYLLIKRKTEVSDLFDRTLTVDLAGGNRAMTLGGDVTTSAGLTTTGTSGVTLAAPSTGSPIIYTLPTTAATLAISSGAQTFTGTQTFSGNLSMTGGTPTLFVGSAGQTSLLFSSTDSWDSTDYFRLGLGKADHYIQGTAASEDVWNGYFGLKILNAGGTPIILGRNATMETQLATTGWLGWKSAGATADASISRNANGVLQIGTTAANAGGTLLLTKIVVGGSTESGATTATKLTKLVSSIADNTATAVLTVTCPNAAHAATVRVKLMGRLGAGGAIGADEASGCITYDVAIARTAGVNAVATISTGYGSATSSVAGAATITVTGDLSAISGAVGASNTFTIRATIARGSGSSANHTCTVLAEILNANSTGISIA